MLFIVIQKFRTVFFENFLSIKSFYDTFYCVNFLAFSLNSKKCLLMMVFDFPLKYYKSGAKLKLFSLF
jgi:hypothetical protein